MGPGAIGTLAPLRGQEGFLLKCCIIFGGEKITIIHCHIWMFPCNSLLSVFTHPAQKNRCLSPFSHQPSFIGQQPCLHGRVVYCIYVPCCQIKLDIERENNIDSSFGMPESLDNTSHFKLVELSSHAFIAFHFFVTLQVL